MGTTLTIEDAMRDPAPTRPVPFEGLPFDIEDLKIAMEWVAIRPSVRLCVATDHCTVQEALEICPSGGKLARWCIWRSNDGHVHLDDWVKAEFNLPYHTVASALAFIDLNL
jgi:hypothetical protein